MQVNRINNNYNTSFNARFKVDPKITEKLIDNVYGPTTISSLTGGASAISTALTGSNVTASSSDVLGTAFSLHASGINSSGIVPSFLKSAANSSLIPTTSVNASAAHPSIVGSFFSTIGGWFHTAKKISKIKDPS